MKAVGTFSREGGGGTVFAHDGMPAKDYPATEAGMFHWAFDTLLALKERPTPKRLQEMMGQTVVNGGHLNGRLSKLYAEAMEREGYVRVWRTMDWRWQKRDELPQGAVAEDFHGTEVVRLP